MGSIFTTFNRQPHEKGMHEEIVILSKFPCHLSGCALKDSIKLCGRVAHSVQEGFANNNLMSS